MIAARRHREHKLATIGSKIILSTTSTNVRDVANVKLSQLITARSVGVEKKSNARRPDRREGF